jgi:UDP-N-acetylglucosamine 4,6-dehydratase
VFLSSDKAAAPNTLYGAHKMAAERAWTQANVYAAGGPTRLCATRYGNVIGSRGSVVPVWRAQVAAGRPITITDKRMTRFWMELSEAVGLVETALTHGRGGEVFVPRVRACDILTFAEAVAPGHDYTEIGIRRGEKLHEVLISEDEARDALDFGSHYRIEPDRTWEHLPPSGGTPLPAGFTLRSNTAPQLSVPELRALLETTA